MGTSKNISTVEVDIEEAGRLAMESTILIVSHFVPQ